MARKVECGECEDLCVIYIQLNSEGNALLDVVVDVGFDVVEDVENV